MNAENKCRQHFCAHERTSIRHSASSTNCMEVHMNAPQSSAAKAACECPAQLLVGVAAIKTVRGNKL